MQGKPQSKNLIEYGVGNRALRSARYLDDFAGAHYQHDLVLV
jgi:hypothetical protein